jgi:hypothetical protein
MIIPCTDLSKKSIKPRKCDTQPVFHTSMGQFTAILSRILMQSSATSMYSKALPFSSRTLRPFSSIIVSEISGSKSIKVRIQLEDRIMSDGSEEERLLNRIHTNLSG